MSQFEPENPESSELPDENDLDAANDLGLEESVDIDATDLELLDGELGDDSHIDGDDGETIGHSLVDAEGAAIETPKARLLHAMRLEAKIEAIIFASQKPLKVPEILEILGDKEVTEDDIQTTLDTLVEFYEERASGFKLHYLKRLGYQFQTVQEAGAIMERMFATRPRPISRAALETLTIVAYRQPVTRAEVEFIRGVDAGSIFKTLLERGLVRCVGRKEIVGRPMLFGTTDEFLKVFNLSSIKDLPPLESFQPSREAMQSAQNKIDEDEGPVDIEQYIADNTAALEGATLADDADFGDDSSEETNEETEEENGTSTSTEMDSPTGFSVSPRGGDLDL